MVHRLALGGSTVATSGPGWHTGRRRGTHRDRTRRRSDEAPIRTCCGSGPLCVSERRTMSPEDLTIATNTVWVVVAAVLVMFMQAGFALLEAGLTRMKNAAHVAGKNVLTFALCSVVYWAVGFGLAFGDGGGAIVGTSGFLPDADDVLGVAVAPFGFFSTIPAAAGYLF